MPAGILGIAFALTAASVWGAGDFCGGYATRRHSQFQVLVLSALSGIAVLVALALLWGESLPSPANAVWAVLAGGAGALGMAALYRGLSLGHAASVAPTAGVIGAGLPVAVGAFLNGLPGPQRLAGFALAFAGIWLVSGVMAQDWHASRSSFALACLAGVSFGGFFVFLGLIDQGPVFTPLVVTRCVTLIVAFSLLLINRLPLISPAANPVAILAGVLDASGNVFYLLARQLTRLDVTAVLSSLYPAMTVFLALLVLRERLTRSQVLGVALCLAAIALISM